MPHLTELLGLAVVDVAGQPAGRLHDLIVDIGQARPPVTGVVVRGRATGSSLVRIDDEPLSITIGAESADDGLWLVRDVLDTQVFDIAGLRISRVGDVELDVASGSMTLVGVDAGLAPVLRRLGLSAVAQRARSRPLRWGELHPLSRRGHSLVLERDPERAHAHMTAARAHRPRLFHRHAAR